MKNSIRKYLYVSCPQTISIKSLHFATNTYACSISSMFYVLSPRKQNVLVNSVERKEKRRKKDFYSWNVCTDITASSSYMKIGPPMPISRVQNLKWLKNKIVLLTFRDTIPPNAYPSSHSWKCHQFRWPPTLFDFAFLNNY